MEQDLWGITEQDLLRGTPELLEELCRAIPGQPKGISAKMFCIFCLVRRVGFALPGAESLRGTVPTQLHPHKQHSRGTELCQLPQNNSDNSHPSHDSTRSPSQCPLLSAASPPSMDTFMSWPRIPHLPQVLPAPLGHNPGHAGHSLVTWKASQAPLGWRS